MRAVKKKKKKKQSTVAATTVTGRREERFAFFEERESFEDLFCVADAAAGEASPEAEAGGGAMVSS